MKAADVSKTAILAFAFSFLAFAAHAQVANGAATANAAESAGTKMAHGSASAAATSSVAAEMTGKVDSRHARVGDDVAAKTTSNAAFADGTKLPKGTKLAGHVTEVSSANDSSHMAFNFDHAVMKDGTQVPIHATLTSMTAKMAAADSPMNDDMMASGGLAGGGLAFGVRDGGFSSAAGGGAMAGGGRAAASSGVAGGLLGGATHSVANTGSNMGGGAMNAVHPASAFASAGVSSSSMGVPSTESGRTAAMVGARSSVVAGDVAGNVSHQAKVPVGNMPGVVLTSGTKSSGSLDARSKSMSVDSGTQMTIDVSR